MELTKSDIEFIKTNLQNSEILLKSNNPNDLIEALHDFTIDTMDQDDEVTDIGRKAERIIDTLAYE